LDVGEKRTSVCVVGGGGETLHEDTCVTSIECLEGILGHFPIGSIALVAMEAGNDVHIARKLLARGYPVSVFEARKASKFLAIRRNKTDASDAKGLADLARLGRHSVSEVRLKSVECQLLRSELLMRQKLVKVRVTVEASIRSRLAMYGRLLKLPNRYRSIRGMIEAEADALLAAEGIDIRPHLDPLTDISENLRQYLRAFDHSLERRAFAHPVCKLLMGIPGVGPISALSFYSAIEDPHRFRPASNVGAFLGLAPRRYQSGEVSRTVGITKTGNKMTRTHLVTAAIMLRKCGKDTALAEWATTLSERLGKRRASVALARKLAVVMLAMWKTGAPYRARETGYAAKVEAPRAAFS
jgi:transposase